MRSLLILCMLVPSVTFAQPGGRSRAAGANLEASQAAAAANAARPGDENLSCEQLQAEVTQIATSGQVTGALGGSPGFAAQAQRAQAAEAAQADAQAIQNAESRGERERLQREAIEAAAPAGVAAGETDGRRGGGGGFGRRLGGALGGFGGGGLGRGRAGAADAAPTENEAPADQEDADDAALAAQIESISGATPQVMRADHLMTLAQRRNCAWVKDYR